MEIFRKKVVPKTFSKCKGKNQFQYLYYNTNTSVKAYKFFEKKLVMDVSLELLGNFSGNPFCTTSSNGWFCFFTLKQRVCSFLNYAIATLMEKNRKT